MHRLLLLFAFLSLATAPAWGQDGQLDVSFGTGGHVLTTFPSGASDVANAVAVQSDGKIVVAGRGYLTNVGGFLVARFNSDGTLDTGFGTGGYVLTDFSGEGEAFGVAMQSDGKIFVAGRAYVGGQNVFAVARYNTDGTLDPGFSFDGKTTTAFLGTSEARDVAVQSDGKIVVVGSADGDFAAVRYNTDGTLDTGFDGDGRATTDFFGKHDDAYEVVLQSDDKIVLGGYSTDATETNWDFALVRYNSDGSLDTGLDGDGKATTDFAEDDEIYALALQDDGKIVAAGLLWGGTETLFGLARYNVDGSLDTSFDGDGKTMTGVPGTDAWAEAVLVQPDGKIVAAGTIGSHPHGDFALVRYNADGSLDTGFDGDGVVTTDFTGAVDRGQAMAFQPDGRIVVAGQASEGDQGDFGLARYDSDGSLDAGFGTGGKVRLAVSTQPGNDVLHALASLPSGKLLAAGSSRSPSGGFGEDFGLVRYDSDGSLDAGFGTGGRVTTDLNGADNVAHAVVVQPDGKILLAGMSSNLAGQQDFMLVRHEADGTLDAGFGTGGIVATDFLGDRDIARAIALQEDGKILVAGDAYDGTHEFAALARYNTDGTLDTGFGTGGKVTIDILGSSSSAFALTVQNDGKIVIAGYAGSPPEMLLARLDSDGTLDPTFDADGFVLPPGGSGLAYAVALQDDGKIVAAGRASGAGGDIDFVVVRYNADGSPDTGFDGDGMVTTDFSGGSDEAYGLALQLDGKIVLTGSVELPGSKYALGLVRYDNDGSLDDDSDGDDGFNTTGTLIEDFGRNIVQGYAVLLQHDGKIVTGGPADISPYHTRQALLARFTGSSGPLPVELTAFEALADADAVVLQWTTASETNNAGFEVQHLRDGTFAPVTFVPGQGTTAEPQSYRYRVEALSPGRHVFRLKQVDFDGAFDYSKEVETVVEVPGEFLLTPVYPNPFNPTARFMLTVRAAQPVQVGLYDALGREVARLYDGSIEAGNPLGIEIDGRHLASGVYLLRATGTHFQATQQVTLAK